MISEKEELKNRVKAKKLRLEAELEEAKADSKEQLRKVKAELEEAEQYLKDGWDNVSEQVSKKLNEWLDRK